ncbi:MAG: DUF6232 family protein [Actinoplanes sp.]
MRVYYRGPDALITESQFVWLAETPRVYPVNELRAARITRRQVKGAWAASTAAAAAASALVLAPGYAILTSVGARLSLVGVAALIVILAVIRTRTGSRWELIASYPGRRLVIYEAYDATTFHQVSRALGRVLENGPVARPRSRSVATTV